MDIKYMDGRRKLRRSRHIESDEDRERYSARASIKTAQGNSTRQRNAPVSLPKFNLPPLEDDDV